MNTEKHNAKKTAHHQSAPVPAGYMENAQGHLVPLANVSTLDQLRNETVTELIAQAEEMGRKVAEFRAAASAAVASFVELAELRAYMKRTLTPGPQMVGAWWIKDYVKETREHLERVGR